jgi:hypothetical protein
MFGGDWMSITVGIRFADTKQVMAKLASLRRSVGNRIMRKAVRAATREMSKTAKAYAPRGELGLLRRAQTNKLARQKKQRTVAGVVGSNAAKEGMNRKGIIAKPANYDHLNERGTKPHAIPRRKGSGLFVWHPGVRGTHYLQRASITSSHAAAQAFNGKAKAGLLAEAIKQRASEVDDGS